MTHLGISLHKTNKPIWREQKMEENKVIETLERMEKKQDTLLESMSVILNYLLSETIQKRTKR